MVIADFQVEDKGVRPWFFQETFLEANTKFEGVLRLLILKISNTDVAFGKGILTWKSYTTNKALPTTKQVQIVDSKEFVIAVLDVDSKTFVAHVAIQEREKMAINLDKKTQIKAPSRAQIQNKLWIGVLLFDEAPIEILAEYSDYIDVVMTENVVELPENTGINEHIIKLEEDKQPPFVPIYSLGPVELETLKTYIKTNLANGFIRPSNFSTGAPIFFN